MKNRTEILIADYLYAKFVIMQLGTNTWQAISLNGVNLELAKTRT